MTKPKKSLTSTNEIPIFFTITNDYAAYAAVAIRSIQLHADASRSYHVIILHDGFSVLNRIRLSQMSAKNFRINFKKIPYTPFLREITTYAHRHNKEASDLFLSPIYFYRVMIPDIFQHIKKGIYLDSDVVLLGDLSELFDMNLNNKTVAGVIDPLVSIIPESKRYTEQIVGVSAGKYINAGVQLMNLEKMRQIQYSQQIIDLIRKYDAHVVAADQDYLNVVLQGEILYLDQKWNTHPSKAIPNDTKIIHFNLFDKPWHYRGVPYGDNFWSVARQTKYYNFLRAQQSAFDEEYQQREREKVEALIKKEGELAAKGVPFFSK